LTEYLRQYFVVDLVSAGLPADDLSKILGNGMDIAEKWKLVTPFWETSRNTGYGQLLDISVEALYGVKRIDGGTIEVLNERFNQTRREGERFRKILKDMCRIKTCMLDDLARRGGIESDPAFYTPVCRIDPWLQIFDQSHLSYVEELSGARIAGFADLLEACKAYLQGIYDAGCRTFKCAVAYGRSLKFKRRTYAEAESAFNGILSSSRGHDGSQSGGADRIRYEDYMLHFILSFANRNDMTIQIHTGIQEGNGNHLANANPAFLENLFPEYPHVWFDLFHIAYPYHHMVGTFAKMYPNVFIDMCWAHAISPAASRTALYEWLDVLPINKVNGFGGDYAFIDAVYGHLELARRNIAHVLAAKVQEGTFDIEHALHTAQMLLYANPKRVFRMEG
jgi:hypothetical protein